jgi:hypothetical protein
MNAGDSQTYDPNGIALQRSRLLTQIQQASAASQGVLRNPSSVLPLVEALNAAAALELRARDHESVSRFANWAVQLCEDALAEESANASVQNELLVSLGTLRDLHMAGGRLEAAAECCSRITGILEQQFESSDDDRELSLALIKNQLELARIRQSQGRLDDAALVVDQAGDLAFEVAEQFHDDQRCHEALARCQRLEHEIDVEQRQLIAAAEADNARRGRRKKTAGAVIALCVIFVVKIAFRGGFIGGNARAPGIPAFAPGTLANLFDCTVEYINEAPTPCTVRLLGTKDHRRKSYAKQLEAGPGAEVRQGLEAFEIDRVVVESAGVTQTTDVRFVLAERGLTQLKIDANLGVRLIKVAEMHRPQGQIAKLVDEGPVRLSRKKEPVR